MVLGLKSKSRKGPSVNVEYIVHVQEIKPWPPSHSLKSLRSVFLQWENGDRSSGSTKSVVPSLGTGVGDGKIEFHESFRIPVILSRELSIKGDSDTFQKNYLELNLYELRSNKNVKGQILGTVMVDFAEYGVLKETKIANVPVNCKRSFRNTAQPVLFMKIEPFHKRNSRYSSRENLSKEASLDKDGRESISALLDRDSDDEAEIESFTDDDDVSQHSSLTGSSSAFETTGDSPPQENAFESTSDNTRAKYTPDDLPLESEAAKSDINAEVASQEYVNNSSPKIDPKFEAQEDHQKITNESSVIKHDGQLHMREKKSSDVEARVASPDVGTLIDDTPCLSTSAEPQFETLNAKKAWGQSRVDADEASQNNSSHAEEVKKQIESGHGERTKGEGNHAAEVEVSYNNSSDVIRKPEESVEDVNRSQKDLDVNNSPPTIGKLKHVKSVRSLSILESGRSKRFENNNQFKETNSSEDAHCNEKNSMQNGEKNDIALPKEVKNNLSGSKVQQLDHRIERLEIELREAAALEVSLYSVVAEHGSSANKVHAPARRLSRLYLHAWKCSKLRASAARSAVSGFVLVAKACGNDVPRLTFWLSNSVVLRAIISLHLGDSQLPVSAAPHIGTNDGGKRIDKGHSILKWEEFSSRKKQNKCVFSEDVDDWEEPHTFTTALEMIEAWIFSRIIESVWWQTLTPHMQSASNSNEEKIYSSARSSYGRRNSLSNQDQANFSMELWKKAFKDACERLCPVRAAGHECGCLPMLARLVMEQCVNRLDVAMFNAILRESADDIPTDPVSDPISDSKVLPIQAGKSSFGAGAQLKNTIGNWSRWLTDLFGIDDDDSHEVQADLNEDEVHENDTSSKSFHLLNALSDLMMLPKDMLLSRSIRKEVCPTFGAPLIKRVLYDFSPDEFCPDPIPEEVFQALDMEDSLDNDEESICNFPCNAAPVIYVPPPAALLASFIGESGKESHLRRSGSSVLRKSYTSDDELDELDSPLSSITDSFRKTSAPSWKAKENGSRSVVRYELLQEVWRDGG